VNQVGHGLIGCRSFRRAEVSGFDSPRLSKVTQQAGWLRPPSRREILGSSAGFVERGHPPDRHPERNESALGPISLALRIKQLFFVCLHSKFIRAIQRRPHQIPSPIRTRLAERFRCFPDPALDWRPWPTNNDGMKSSTRGGSRPRRYGVCWAVCEGVPGGYAKLFCFRASSSKPENGAGGPFPKVACE